jgi:hypothetical protein
MISLGDEPLVDISFLQLEDPLGGSALIVPYSGDDAAMTSNGLSIHPNATYELLEDGKLGVITFPLDSKFFNDTSSDATFAVSGQAITGMSEQSFHMEVGFPPTGPSKKGPCDALTLEEEEVLDTLNLANTKETGGCNCQINRPSPSMALAPAPPEKPPCPEKALVATPSTNEITL